MATTGSMQAQPYFSGFDPLPPDCAERLLPDARPQFLGSDRNSDAVVICIHGFTGTPFEVAPAAIALANIDLPAVLPLLPGHGFQNPAEQKREFARITKVGLLDAIRQEVHRARQQYSKVGMFGLSMGGAIALGMAAEGLIDACAVAAPALKLPPQAELLIPLLGWANFTVPAPSQEPFYLPGYEFYHSRALRTLWQIGRYASSALHRIECPVLAMHSHNDPRVPPTVLDLIQKTVPAQVETAWFDESGHSMLLDVRGSDVAHTIAKFFQHQLLT